MTVSGELVSLIVALFQELGIIAGVGAMTVTLIGHLLGLHARHGDTARAYMRAAHHVRAAALIAILVSGGAAVLIHFASGTPGVLAAPAFLFKWLLIALVTAFHFTEWNAAGIGQDAVEGFEGANWYALFIVHTLAPVLGWTFILELYAGWIATFAAIWAVFVWLMRRQSTLGKPDAPKPAAEKPAPVAAKQAPVAEKKPEPPAPGPAAPAPAGKRPVEAHPNHSILPMVAELELPAPHEAEAPAPKHVDPAPAPIPAAPPPKPVPPPAPAPAPVPPPAAAPMPDMDIDARDLPALHVMPQREEDIGSSKRGPVVKLGED